MGILKAWILANLTRSKEASKNNEKLGDTGFIVTPNKLLYLHAAHSAGLRNFMTGAEQDDANN